MSIEESDYTPKNRGRVVSIYEQSWPRDLSNPGSKLDLNRTRESLEYFQDDVSDPYNLLYFKSSLYASVLEDTITEIRILGECNSQLRILKTLADMVILRANKYSVAQPAVTDDLDGINLKDLDREEYKLDKLANDRKYLLEALLANYLDLSLNRTFRALVDGINEIKEREDHLAFLLGDEAKNRVTRRELARQLRQQRNHIKSVYYDTDIVIENLKTEVEDAALNAEIRTRYVTNWQGARTEQHHQTIRDKEARPLHHIDYYKQRTDHEQRVHSEIELLTNIIINEKLEKVESWMNKYDKDMEAMDLKIQIMKNDHTNTLENRMQLEDTFAKHDKLMKDWQQFKDEREKARQYREKMTAAATVVQAWWRGLLVRLQIGPYKPTKKPPPKADKKKKK